MARKKKHNEGEHANEERWLLPYADMITLLLALFIVLFAMSTIDVHKAEALRRVLSDQFRGQVNTGSQKILNGSENPLNPEAPSQIQSNPFLSIRDRESQDQAKRENNVKDQVAKLVKAGNLQGQVEAIRDKRGLVIRLNDSLLFASGSATISPKGRQVLSKLAPGLRKLPNEIEIEGHTDGAPISQGLYRDNYSLGAERAHEVLRLLGRSAGIPRARMHASSYADTEPLVKPPTPTAHVARNRRVEIVLMALSSSTDSVPFAAPGATKGLDMQEILRSVAARESGR